MTKRVSLQQLYALSLKHFATKTVVLATGVFDILHSEHTKFLRAAKAAGDILTVGLETNQRVRALKGPTRPFNSITKRLRNLATLNIADYVFELPGNLGTPQGREEFIQQLHPHILAVSSHSPNLPEKRRIMSLVGGQVKVVLSHNPSLSTTIITKQNRLR